MAVNLQSTLRIAAEVTGLGDLGKLEKGILAADKAAGGLKDGLKSVISSDIFQVAAVGAAALGTAMVIATKQAIEFDSAFAGVRKVVGDVDTKGLDAMRSSILKLSKEIPIVATELAKIFAAAGQAGIPAKEIEKFAEDVAKIAVAFDMTAEQAGTAMAKLRTSLGLSQDDLSSLADAMNHLSNNTASTAAQITEFVLRTGTVGKSAGLSAEQTAAFGAAMVSAGANAEVAATSFNNMIKALGRGESMTERQMSALKRLGLVTVDAGKLEKEYTDKVEQQSRERLAIARAETNALRKEIDRRYRDQLQSVNDVFDDETEAFQKALRDRDEAQTKALQREQDKVIDAARARAEATGGSSEVEIERIRDFYEQRIDALRDNTDAEIKQRSRADRDRLQAIQDNMNDAKDIELNSLTERFEAAKQLEAKRLEESKVTAKAAAEALSKEVSQTLAKNLQTDAIGTITDVFNRIRALPREQQIPVISDLFGDEAKAIMPLIQNQKLLADALQLVGDKTKYAGSWQKEYLNVLGTQASQLQLVRNRVNVLAIEFGSTLAPALIKVLEFLIPIIDGFGKLLTDFPALGPVLAILAGGFVALVAVLPALGSLVFLLQSMGGLASIFATIAGYLGALGPAIAAVSGFLSTAGTALVAFFTGPVGWAVLLVAAGAAIYAFRDQIGDVFNAIGFILQEGAAAFKSMFIDPVVAGFTAVVQFVTTNFVTPVKASITGLVQMIGDTFKNVTKAITSPFEAAFQTVRGIVNNILNGIGDAIGSVVRAINNMIRGANRALARLGLPQIPFLPQPNIPKFAEGGVVSGPTLAMVGEGGEPEYIVPQSKASGFAANWMAGKRGAAAIPAFANGGFVMPSGAMPRFAEGGMVVPGNAQVSIQTGPVTQIDGTNYVTTQDMSRAVQVGVQQTLNMMRNDRGTRRSIGLA